MAILKLRGVDQTTGQAREFIDGSDTFGNMSVRGSSQNLRAEVEWYLRLEQRARQRWRKEMAMIGTNDLSVRLAEANAGSVEREVEC